MYRKERAYTKLSPRMVLDIRRRATGKNDKELQAEYGLKCRHTIWAIRTWRKWKWLKDESQLLST